MKNIILNNKLVRSVVLASSLVMSAFSAQADLVLSFGESDIEVGLNDSFTIDLFVDVTAQQDSILSWGLDLDFSDSSIVTLNSFTLGSDFLSFDAANPLIDTDGIGGTSTSLFGTFGNSVLLGTFAFTAIETGSTSLGTSNSIADLFEGFTTINFFGGPTEFNSASADITVTGDSTVAASAPAALGLFAIALVGLVSLRRKA